MATTELGSVVGCNSSEGMSGYMVKESKWLQLLRSPWIFMNRHHALPMLISVSLLEFTKHKMLNNMSASFLWKETSKRKRKKIIISYLSTQRQPCLKLSKPLWIVSFVCEYICVYVYIPV